MGVKAVLRIAYSNQKFVKIKTKHCTNSLSFDTCSDTLKIRFFKGYGRIVLNNNFLKLNSHLNA